MITIHDLIEDPVWRKEVLLTPPQLPAHLYHHTPWRLYVQSKDGRWARKDFATYGEAFKVLKKHLKSCRDACIVSRAVAFPPPMRMVRIKGQFVVGSDGVQRQATKRVPWDFKFSPEDELGHKWCPYCRRPTIFKWFKTHHALDPRLIDSSKLRCTICGSSTDIAYYEKSKQS